MTKKTNEWIGVIEEVNTNCQFANFTLPHTNIQVKCNDLRIYNKLKKTLQEFSEKNGGI